MQAIILLVSRSRFVIPRVGNFLYAQQFAAATYPHQPFVYQGRALDMTEFNEAATRLLDVRNPHLGYEVSVRLLAEEPPAEEPPAEEPTAVEPTAVEPTAVEPTAEEPTAVEPTAVEPTVEEPVLKPASKRSSKSRPTIETEIA